MDDRQWSPRIDWPTRPFRDPEGHCTPSFSVNRVNRARIITTLYSVEHGQLSGIKNRRMHMGSVDTLRSDGS